MKYIRTKDGRIIDTTKYYIENSNLFKNGAWREYEEELKNAIKQADNIKELCDEFVFICEDFNKPQLVIPMNFDYCKKEFNHTEIYGAIWTNKGLIYKAKMKGVLPNGEIDWELL